MPLSSKVWGNSQARLSVDRRWDSDFLLNLQQAWPSSGTIKWLWSHPFTVLSPCLSSCFSALCLSLCCSFYLISFSLFFFLLSHPHVHTETNINNAHILWFPLLPSVFIPLFILTSPSLNRIGASAICHNDKVTLFFFSTSLLLISSHSPMIQCSIEKTKNFALLPFLSSHLPSEEKRIWVEHYTGPCLC